MSNNKNINKMKNQELTIGTKVTYTQTHIHSEPTQHESTIKGFLPEGWVLLENGDTFTKSALNIVTESNEHTALRLAQLNLMNILHGVTK